MTSLKRRKTWLRVVACAIAFLVLPAAPASAHGSGQAKPTNYLSALDTFMPPPGVRLKVVNAGDRLQLTNTSSTDLTVLGYDGEPYLRVGPEGTFVNIYSPAYYLNRTTNPTAPAPAQADATKPPNWQKESGSQTVFWHDHRIHWMGTVSPPEVRAAPGKTHVVIAQWTIQFQQGAQAFDATGHVSWIPGPSPVLWNIMIGLLLLAGLSIAFLTRTRFSNRTQLALCSALGVLIVFDAFHTVGTALATTGTLTTRLGIISQSATPSVIAWAVGIYGVVRLRCNSEDGIWFVLFAAAIITVLGGLTDLNALESSQIPTSLPYWLARAAVTVSTGLGMGVTVSAFVFILRQRNALAGQKFDPVEPLDVANLAETKSSASR